MTILKHRIGAVLLGACAAASLLTPAAHADPAGTLTSLLNRGSAVLGPALNAVSPLAGVPGNVNAPDLNADGRPDVATPDFGTDFLSVRINRGDGTFGPLRRYKVGVKPSFVARGDFNRDGKLDLATSNAVSGDVSLLLGNGDGTLRAARSISISAPGSYSNGSFSLEAVDVNGDGHLDIVTSNSITNDISIVRGNGNGTFMPAMTFPIAGPHSIGILPFALSMDDLDHDGDLDVVTGGIEAVTVMLNDGRGRFRSTSANHVGLDIACTKIGDLDEDGDPDLVATGTGTLNALVLLNNGAGAFTAGENLFSLGVGPQCFSLADFNGDGHLDMSVVNSASQYGRGVVGVLLGDGTGHFKGDLLKTTYPVQFAPWATDAVDFDGDGKLDLAVANSEPASVSILRGNGNGTFRKQTPYGM